MTAFLPQPLRLLRRRVFPTPARQLITTLVVFTCAAIVPVSTSACPADAPELGAPNIVLILADDLGLGDLGCYGQTRLKTPHIDRLAAEGMRFRHAYSGASVCAPSRCALMTGRHMGHATVRGNWEVFPEGQAPLGRDEVTIAALLRQANYATGICGKWGLGAPGSGSAPNDKGFDFFFGYNCQRHAHRYVTDYLYRNEQRVEIPQSPEDQTNAHELIVHESLEFIRRNQARPFFLFCAWTVPHGIWRRDQVPSLEAYQDTGWTETQQVYAAMVEQLDADVGRVRDTLKQLGLEQRTLILFASDNGGVGEQEIADHFGSHAGLRGAKGQIWEGGLRVPMIACWPGHVPADTTSDFPTAFWDFLPTAARLAEVPVPQNADGISLLPVLRGNPPVSRPPLYWEQQRGNQLEAAARLGTWKVYRPASHKPLQLYDLAQDPAESTDVAAAHPDVVEQLEEIMAACHSDVEIPPADPRVWPKYREDNARLDALIGWPPAPKP